MIVEKTTDGLLQKPHDMVVNGTITVALCLLKWYTRIKQESGPGEADMSKQTLHKIRREWCAAKHPYGLSE